jgi:ThiF family
VKSWHERDGERYNAERQFWLDNGFSESTAGGKVSFAGEVEVQAGASDHALERRSFTVRVVYPDAFPYRPPDVEFIEPRIRGSRHQSPHGPPCLFPVRDWTQFVPASEFHNALRRWLAGWMLDSFPRELALYELPEYFAASPLSVLCQPAAFDAFRGKERGTFGLLCAAGRDLGVLKSVDNAPVAKELLDGLRMGSEVKQSTRNGKWFRLNEQPPFVRFTGQLAAVLQRNGHQFSAGRQPTEHGFVGLVFNDAVLHEERLLLLDFSAQGSKASPKPEGWPLRSPWLYVVSEDELFRRLEGVHEVHALRDCNVVVLGAGAIGSSLVLDLAREGVGGLVLCDPDRLRPGNLMRHALDLLAVGQRKAEAAEVAVGRVNPYAETWSETDNLDDPGVLANLMRTDHPAHPADLVVSAIGDDAMEGLVSEVAVATESAPVLFVRTLHDGDLVRLMLLRPGRDACLECLRLHADDAHPDFIDSPDNELSPVFDAGCATAAQPGAGLASRQAAVLGAKRALATLLTADSDINHWLWVDRAIPTAPDARLHVAETMYASHLPPHPGCPFCT